MRTDARDTLLLTMLALAVSASATSPAVASGAPRLEGAFLWGVASSGFQTEGGGPRTQWNRYMDAGAAEQLGSSVDFRHRYREDIRLAARLGANTYRFGISWARVQPKPGVFDERELRYYDDVVRHIIAAGMKPIITLQHFAIPEWTLVRNGGGWEKSATVDDWLPYVRRVVARYAGLRAYWITFNEPEIDAVLEGKHRSADGTALVANQVAAHRAAYDLIHAADPTAKVTMSHYCICLRGPDGSASDAADFTLDQIADKNDLIALDWYQRVDSPTDLLHAGVTGEPWNVDIDPVGMLEALRTLHRRFPTKPILVSENGMATPGGGPRPDGYRRCEHLSDMVWQVQAALAEGIPVIGYEYWSITDNYEWGSFAPRFGLYQVDAGTDPQLTRRPTDGVATYRSLVQRGGAPDGYLPVKGEGGFRPGHENYACVTGRDSDRVPRLTMAAVNTQRLRPMHRPRNAVRLYPPRAGARGAVLGFMLDRPATVRLNLVRIGRRTARPRPAVRLTRPGGPARVVLTGWWKGRRLRPGDYRLKLRANAGSAASAATTLRLRVR